MAQKIQRPDDYTTHLPDQRYTQSSHPNSLTCPVGQYSIAHIHREGYTPELVLFYSAASWASLFWIPTTFTLNIILARSHNMAFSRDSFNKSVLTQRKNPFISPCVHYGYAIFAQRIKHLLLLEKHGLCRDSPNTSSGYLSQSQHTTDCQAYCSMFFLPPADPQSSSDGIWLVLTSNPIT